MYLCNKNFNIRLTYGIQRIMLISALLGIIVYIVSFEVFSAIFGKKFSDDNFLLFVASLLCLYPVHKLLHMLPFIQDTKSLIIQKTSKSKYFPLFNTRVNHPVHKLHFAFALMCPVVIITIITIVGAVMYTQFAHYFLFIFAVNIGLSFIDFVYLKYIMSTPQCSFVEERKYGLEVLSKHDLPLNFHHSDIR
ncbi:DUF3267 domain-containing protein [Macrococcus armenti]|uniref:DUF3267 domain-containing protein n=1 Tax=Macrococcus armenti TaxID=2875764 RepID=UPI001CCDD160|nr:DUF3267 domain-containing protein [Macrococcus armenti]UBH21831.1 DUF3267 domain-containing protein [Macrococcus armenti]